MPFPEESVDDLLKSTKIELLDSIEAIVQNTDLIFCSVQTPHNPKYEGDETSR